MDTKNLKGQIHNAMYQSLCKKGWVAPVDVLMDIGVLRREHYENWRFGRGVPYLERACLVNLRQLSVIMSEIRAYARKNDLKPSWSCYHQWGKHKQNRLRFSKSGDEKVERHYATHFVDTERIAALKAQRAAVEPPADEQA
ncbi:MAG: hypothetical protein FWC27_09880 [Firmicutes bacterium]|nr:hypothetical protein [Bacillota bacterium]